MDAGASAELDALRERAYGPAADIQDDPAALARLEELERLARPAGASDSAPSPLAAAAATSTRREPASIDPSPREPEPARPEPRPDGVEGSEKAQPSPRGRRRTALVAGIVAATVLIGAVAIVGALTAGETEPVAEAGPAEASGAPYLFAPTTDSVVLIRVPIDGSFGSARSLPAAEIPNFPVPGEVLWAEFLGEYYGFDLWIGGVSDVAQRQLCLLVLDAEGAQEAAACGARGTWEGGAMFASVPYARIAPDERPDPFDAQESLGFWWTPDDTVYILRGGSSVVRVDD